MITKAPITVRDVLRLLLAADSYPRLGNHDWREAGISNTEREEVYFALHDFFDDGSDCAPAA